MFVIAFVARVARTLSSASARLHLDAQVMECWVLRSVCKARQLVSRPVATLMRFLLRQTTNGLAVVYSLQDQTYNERRHFAVQLSVISNSSSYCMHEVMFCPWKCLAIERRGMCSIVRSVTLTIPRLETLSSRLGCCCPTSGDAEQRPFRRCLLTSLSASMHGVITFHCTAVHLALQRFVAKNTRELKVWPAVAAV